MHVILTLARVVRREACAGCMVCAANINRKAGEGGVVRSR